MSVQVVEVINSESLCRMTFEGDRNWALAYAHCDENNMLPELWKAQSNGVLDEFYKRIGIHEGTYTANVGNWSALL